MSECNNPLIAKLIRAEVLSLKAYHVPDASGMIKLDAMENPYSWSAEIRRAWLNKLERAELNRYPDPSCKALVQKIKQTFEIAEGHEVLLGNGSDEIIHILINAIAKPGARVMSFEPGFVMYEYIALYNQLDYIKIPLSDQFQIDIELTLSEIEYYQPEIIFIAYPNNPSGNLFDDDSIKKIIEASQGLVIIDEAYAAFAKLSYMDKMSQYENLLVLRTLSKMGLAGLRLGYLSGNPAWISEFDKIRLPYNINVLTQLSAEFALDNKAILDQQTEQICFDRKTLYQQLVLIPELSVYPSDANFILFRTAEDQANDIHKYLIEKKILIKNLSNAGPQLKDCLRVTVGTADENQKFIEALQVFLAN